MKKCEVIAITNQKGGVGKTTTAVNLVEGLANQGKSIFAYDRDGKVAQAYESLAKEVLSIEREEARLRADSVR